MMHFYLLIFNEVIEHKGEASAGSWKKPCGFIFPGKPAVMDIFLNVNMSLTRPIQSHQDSWNVCGRPQIYFKT